MATSVVFLVLLLVANGAPIVARGLLGARCRHPVDGGWALPDGRRLFGDGKTWIGLAASAVSTSIVAAILGMSPRLGLAIALLAMIGDLFASFTKRRLGVASGAITHGLDQMPEALLPALLLGPALGLSIRDALAAAVVFVLIGLLLQVLATPPYPRRRAP